MYKFLILGDYQTYMLTAQSLLVLNTMSIMRNKSIMCSCKEIMPYYVRLLTLRQILAYYSPRNLLLVAICLIGAQRLLLLRVIPHAMLDLVSYIY